MLKTNVDGISEKTFEMAFNETRSKARRLEEADGIVLNEQEKMFLANYYALERSIQQRKTAWEKMTEADINIIRMFWILGIDLEEMENEVSHVTVQTEKEPSGTASN